MKKSIKYHPAASMLALFFLTAIVASGCSWLFYDRYQVFDDEFKNSSKAIVRINNRPLEARTEIGNADIIFEREYSNRIDITRAYFVIARSSSSFKVADQGYFKIDDETYEVFPDGLVTEQKIKTETTSSTFAKTDSTSVTTGSTIESDTDIWIDDKFIITLTKEMIEKISDSERLLVRFYFGPIPATYRIRGTDLNLLKRML